MPNPCPACGKSIAVDDLNIPQGVGLCRACGKLSRLDDIADQPGVTVAAVIDPPAGCAYGGPFAGEGTVVRVSLRSLGSAAGLLAFCLFWNGIVSVFVLGAIGGLYKHFVGPLPPWYPFHAARRPGKTDMTDSLGQTLFLCAFITPFVCIGIGATVAFVLSLIGRIEVRIDETVGRIRTGVGPLNWTRRFDPTRVRRVVPVHEYGGKGGAKDYIRIDGDGRPVKFGSMLPATRRKWLLGVLHLLLVAPGNAARRRTGLTTAVRT